MMVTRFHTAPAGASATIRKAVEAWEGVSTHPHRFGGVEFQAGGRELGHLHGDRLADLLLPKAVHDRVIAEGTAQPHHVLPDSNWVSVSIHSSADVQTVIVLLRAAYDRAMQHPLRIRKGGQSHDGE
jgi:hypothetical protein